MTLLLEQAKIKLLLAWCDNSVIEDLKDRSDQQLQDIIEAYRNDRTYTYEKLDIPRKCIITQIRKWFIKVTYSDEQFN